MKKNLTAIINGGQKPHGKVKVSGAKNAATRLLAAALVADEKVTLQNFPTELVDANYKFDFIRKSGGTVEVDEESETITIDPASLSDRLLSDYNFPIRTTYLLVAGLIKKSGRARIPYPGGCKIGNRGYDLHVMVWEKMGAMVEEKEDYIEVSAAGGFQPAAIDFPISTIGGTESALICAAIADGVTTIKNAYISPEVDCLIDFLRTLGATVEVVGNSFVKVTGRKQLQGSIFQVMPDRIEALTWVVLGILTQGDILVEDVPFSAMEIPLIHLKEAGIDYYYNTKSIRVSPECLTNGVIQPFELATGTHPGIISDMQPFYTLLGLHGDGISRVYDYRYPERIKYCEELNKMYTDGLKWETGAITTYGKKDVRPKGAHVNSTDLRGSMALVMAGLVAEGETVVSNVEMALRGYNKLETKLNSLGIHIEVR